MGDSVGFLRGLLMVVLCCILADGHHDGWLPGGIAFAVATRTGLKPQPPTRQNLRFAGVAW